MLVTKRELVEFLEDYDDDTLIMVRSGTPDYWGTQRVQAARPEDTEVHEGYYKGGWCEVNDNHERPEEGKIRQAVLL